MMATAFLGKNSCLTWIYTSPLIEEYWPIHLSSLPVVCSERLRLILDKHQITPKLVFENLSKISSKATAYQLLQPFAGVYTIVNLVNGKCYVGSAITGNLYNRFNSHLYSFRGSRLLAKSVQKYGRDNFAFVLVETI